MSIIEAIILGLVQGLTEFIPVSSSGHLLLAHELFGTSENTLGFDVALHVGTLAALLVFFRSDIYKLARNLFAKNADGRLARLLACATMPALIAGLLFSDIVDEHLRSPMIVAVSLSVVAVLMLIAHRKKSDEAKEVTFRNGLLVGLAQCAALIPGVSRSGATITTGLFLGFAREQAARFSFLLAIPIVGGSALGLLVKDANAFSQESTTTLLIGMLVAFSSGLLAISYMLRVIARVGLKAFAYYRLVLAAVVLVVMV